MARTTIDHLIINSPYEEGTVLDLRPREPEPSIKT